MEQDQNSYFLKRAEAELELASSSEHPEVVRAHYLLAGLYLDRVYGPDGSDGAQGAPSA
jgi:hypothetical protein